jgi:hypothetical protein
MQGRCLAPAARNLLNVQQLLSANEVKTTGA